MSVFKYFSLDGGLRFLSTWALRLTPPNLFNDPFEMRPRFSAANMNRARKMVPQIIREELTKTLADLAAKEGVNVSADQMSNLVSLLIAEPDDGKATQVAEYLEKLNSPGTKQFLDIRKLLQANMPLAMTQIAAQMPLINQAFESAISATLPKVIGVTCLSGSQKSPLMWSHYADGHQGVLIEFDEAHPTFNRRRHSTDDFGFLRRVAYSDTRPNIELLEGREVYDQMALIKALDWAYEQEQRFIWPLELADRQITTLSETIHLIDVPPSAIKTVTMGCKASDVAFLKVNAELSRHPAAAHVITRRSRIADDSFELLYSQ